MSRGNVGLLVALMSTAVMPVHVHAQEAAAAANAGEIVVTAQRREESISKVPISITAVSPEVLKEQQIRTTLDLPKMVAGIEVSHNGLWTTPFIRGVGSRVGENSVAQYVDGVYLPNPVTALNEFAVVERIEVLKGPQGTLFGRNATAGAINVITPDPNLNEIEAQGSAFVEERVGVGATGYVSIPLSDMIAFSVSGNYRRSDGWVKNGDNSGFGGTNPLAVGTPLNPLKHAGVRAKLRFKPTDTTDIVLSVWNGSMNEPGATAYSPISNQLFAGTSDGNLGTIVPKFVAFAYQAPSNKANFTQYVGKLNQDIGDNWHLQSITSYRKDHNVIAVDVAQTAIVPFIATWDSKQKSKSQEFILTGEMGSLNATAGLFLFDDKFVKEYAGAFHHQDTTSVAPFVDLTYSVTPQLKVIGGLRYTYEKRKFHYQSFDSSVDFKAQKSTRNWSPRAVVQYDLDGRSNVYGSFSIGYKSGLFNTDATGLTSATDLAAQPLNSEKLTAYEVGFKHGSHALTLAAAAFYYDWKNIQTNRYVAGNTIAQNGPKAEIYGLELQLDYRPIDNLSIFLNGTLMHGRFKDFKDGSASVQGTAGDFYDVNNPNDPLAVNVSQDWSGQRLLNAPDLAFNAGFNWKMPIGPGEFSVSPNVKYTSTYAPDLILIGSNGKNVLNKPSMALVDLSVGYEFGNMKVTGYVRNLFDKAYYAEPNYTALGRYSLWGEPQTFGVRLEFKY